MGRGKQARERSRELPRMVIRTPEATRRDNRHHESTAKLQEVKLIVKFVKKLNQYEKRYTWGLGINEIRVTEENSTKKKASLL